MNQSKSMNQSVSQSSIKSDPYIAVKQEEPVVKEPVNVDLVDSDVEMMDTEFQERPLSASSNIEQESKDEVPCDTTNANDVEMKEIGSEQEKVPLIRKPRRMGNIRKRVNSGFNFKAAMRGLSTTDDDKNESASTTDNVATTQEKEKEYEVTTFQNGEEVNAKKPEDVPVPKDSFESLGEAVKQFQDQEKMKDDMKCDSSVSTIDTPLPMDTPPQSVVSGGDVVTSNDASNQPEQAEPEKKVEQEKVPEEKVPDAHVVPHGKEDAHHVTKLKEPIPFESGNQTWSMSQIEGKTKDNKSSVKVKFTHPRWVNPLHVTVTDKKSDIPQQMAPMEVVNFLQQQAIYNKFINDYLENGSHYVMVGA